MANYQYTGLSFYIQLNERTDVLFDIVRAYIEPYLNDHNAFQPSSRTINEVGDIVFEDLGYEPEMSVFNEKELEIIDQLKQKINTETLTNIPLYPTDAYPGNTPLDKQKLFSEIRNEHLYLYTPIVRKRDIDEIRAYILNVITTIFGNDVVQIAEIQSDETKSFTDSTPKLLYKKA